MKFIRADSLVNTSSLNCGASISISWINESAALALVYADLVCYQDKMMDLRSTEEPVNHQLQYLSTTQRPQLFNSYQIS